MQPLRVRHLLFLQTLSPRHFLRRFLPPPAASHQLFAIVSGRAQGIIAIELRQRRASLII
jgi:hypothetical protein